MRYAGGRRTEDGGRRERNRISIRILGSNEHKVSGSGRTERTERREVGRKEKRRREEKIECGGRAEYVRSGRRTRGWEVSRVQGGGFKLPGDQYWS
jgi:hypothetical protein